MKRYIAVFLILAGAASATVTTTDNTATHACNGSAIQFTFGFPISGTDTSQLRVILRTVATGAETILTETIDYSVSAVNNDYSGGGTVTTVQTYSSAYALSIVRATHVTQTADLSTKSSVSYASLESYFDKMIMVIQDLTQKLALTLTAPGSDSGTSYEIPEAAIRAGKYLAFDSSGNPIASSGTVGPVAASAFGENLVDDTDAAAARSTLELGDISTLNIDTDGTLAANSDSLIATQKAVKAYVDTADNAVAAYNVPVGSIMPYAGSSAPTGWLICDGTLIDNTGGTYDNLYSIIGTTYGGAGQTSFNTPDLKGRTIIGAGQASNVKWGGSAYDAVGTDFALGDASGYEDHRLTSTESGLPAHTHTITLDRNYNGVGGVCSSHPGSDAGTRSTNANTAQDASAAHNNMQPYLTLNYIIKY